MRPVGWSGFALRRRFWWAKVGFGSPLPGRVGPDVFGKRVGKGSGFGGCAAGWLARFWGTGARWWGTAVWCGGGFGRETAVGVWRLLGKAGADVVGKAVPRTATVLPFAARVGW